MPQLVPIRATAATSRVLTTLQRNFAAPRSAPRPLRPRLDKPIPTRIRSLRRLHRPAERARHHFAVSPLPNILSRPSTTVHRESLMVCTVTV